MSVRTQPGCSIANKISSFWSSAAAHTVSMFSAHWGDGAAESQVRLKKKRAVKKVGEMLSYGSGSDGWALTLLMR